MSARDGIKGPWVDVSMHPPKQAVNDPNNLARWSLAVRELTILHEMQSHLTVQPKHKDAKEGARDVSLHHINKGASADGLEPMAVTLAAFDRPDSSYLKQQLRLVNSYADLRGDRMNEILTQTGYPTPFFNVISGLHPAQKKYTHELVGITQSLVSSIVLSIKHVLAVPRPDTFSHQIQPAIPTPGHGTLPSGHAAENFAVAVVLAHLLENRATDGSLTNMLIRQAARIAANRTVAGVHFPIDSVAGAMLGIVMGQYIVSRSTGTSIAKSAEFIASTASGADPAQDFIVTNYMIADLTKGPQLPTNPILSKTVKIGTEVTIETVPNSPITWLWDQAVSEWV
ncbi:phosphatase PAP2 family protein [Ahrensia sp. R2A130]|uniref:phosphatase PAP2 family protein n=1 Tax=Ahrensia sp. R2A130 TaxID=744979 RepID=UPI0018DD23F3|nr:phosphatase PAP2 family protein [Ahrensia sp. R2A130]